MRDRPIDNGFDVSYFPGDRVVLNAVKAPGVDISLKVIVGEHHYRYMADCRKDRAAQAV